mgnify:FL=1
MNQPATTLAPQAWVVDPGHHGLREAISTLAVATTSETNHPFSEIERLLPNFFPISSAKIVIASQVGWTHWDDQQAIVSELASLCSAGKGTRERSTKLSNDVTFFPIRDNSVGLLVHVLPGAKLPEHEFFVCSRFLETAVSRTLALPPGPSRHEVITAFSQVANTILKSGDLAEIFFNITRVANSELAADICGIMLLDGNHLVMQRCVGNESAATASLRMKTGQGVDGRVLEMGKPCTVENYLSSSHISQDFFDLARAERVRSALAVPLYSRDEIIGVLEVWRRRPSIFTQNNIAELAALADLASLAIANTKLLSAREKAMQQLEAANATITARANTIENAADLQTKLVKCVIYDNDLQEIVSLAAKETGASVYVCDQKLEVRAQSGQHATLTASDLAKLRTELATVPRDDMSAKTVKIGTDGHKVFAQRLSAVSSQRGWTLLVKPGRSREAALLALASISISVTLFDVKSQAAASVLSEKVSSLVWDLIDAPKTVRALAIEKLRELGKELRTPLAIILCSLESQSKDAHGRHSEWDFDVRRRLVEDIIAHGNIGSKGTLIASFKENELAVVVSSTDQRHTENLIRRLEGQVRQTFSGARWAIGISASCHDPLNLQDSLKEARLAKKVATLASSRRTIRFDEIGLLGLIMGLQEGIGFNDFAAKVLKGIAGDDQAQSVTLRETLKAFLESNCNQRDAARLLAVHPKTVAYRLEKIEAISGLSLRNHEHRILFELALKTHDLGISNFKA